MLNNKKILLGITGGIAAYKTPEFIRLLIQQGVTVKTVLTDSAERFVTPLTLQTLSNQPVFTSLWACEEKISHIELARWADAILIAPATANFISKLAHGFSDDLLSTLCLATTSPIIVAPAMNQQMYLNSFTQENINKLLAHNITLWGPDVGIQACGENGPGRLLEPEILLAHLNNFFAPKLLSHKNILITAGPTQEAIDPVRYITNHSSGKMGYALAEAALNAGANVTLISGPTNLSCSTAINKINIITAEEMHKAVLNNIHKQDVFIAAAAVSDYKPEFVSSQKIKKHSDKIELTLAKNTDILKSISDITSNKKLIKIGFAAETENLLENAKQKLLSKKLDMVIANLVGKDLGFNSDDNQLSVITPHDITDLPKASKKDLAQKIMSRIAALIGS
ncbi:MAG: bifunctional phosphopantothenoylcysteine decarboxylase/phosphopantothenate--cysteine ligase CoaBC [Gammaproteobacteria bacterium]|nr:bifunctional phosphopantothenoylcysteine decarboxylase/phosphopantothenate--cysteine ligase CoaBC [Gammaproteobacteria bacterium]